MTPAVQKMSLCASGMPVEQRRLAFRETPVGGRGLRERLLRGHRDERVQCVVEALDAREEMARELGRGDAPRAEVTG